MGRRIVPELPGIALLDALAPKERVRMCRSATARSYQRGDVIFHQDDSAEGVFLLTRGVVRVTRCASGRSVTIVAASAPAAIATAGLIDGGANAITGIAASRSEASLVPRQEVLQAVSRSPAAMNWLLTDLCRGMRLLASALDSMALGSVRQRLARALVEMTQEAGGTEVLLGYNQEEFAHRLGTVREVLFRNLRWMEAEGLLHRQRRVITIDDLPALKDTAGLRLS